MTKQLIAALAFAVALTACTTKSNKQETQAEKSNSSKAKTRIELYTDSIGYDSTNANYYLIRAKEYFAHERIGNAFSDVSKALSLEKDNVEAYLMLADIYYELGDEQNVTEALTRAADIAPSDARPLVKLAELSLLRENQNLALIYLDKALAINKFNPQAYFVRGQLFLSRGDTVSAIKNYQIARTQDEDFFAASYAVGSLYADMNNKLAVEYLTDAIKRFPNNLGPRYRLAMYLQENGQPNQALSHYDTLIEQQPDNKSFVFNKGYVHLVYFSNYDEAIDCFDRALAIDPNYIDALYNKAFALELIKRDNDAARLYRAILQMNPNYELAIDALNRIGK